MNDRHEQDHREARRGGMLLIAALILAFATYYGGGKLRQEFAPQVSAIGDLLITACWVIPLLLIVATVVLSKVYLERIQAQNIPSKNTFYITHLDEARQVADEKQKKLLRMHRGQMLYGLLLAVFGFGLAFSAGVYTNRGSLWCYASAFLYLAALSCIPFYRGETLHFENMAFIKEKDYPQLFALTKDAVEKSGCEGEVRISLLPDFELAVSFDHDVIYVHLGVVMLSVMSEEELQVMMVHELVRIQKTEEGAALVHQHALWRKGGGTDNPFHVLTKLFLQLYEVRFAYEYMLYSCAAAALDGIASGREVSKHFDRRIVASALVKLQYHTLFKWSQGAQDKPSEYAPKEPGTDMVSRAVDDFKVAIAENADRWDQFITGEIMAENAIRPTVKMYLRAMGVDKAATVSCQDAPAFDAERQKAILLMDSVFCESVQQTYKIIRKQRYSPAKTSVENWENAGQPVVAGEYATVVDALNELGACSRADALCRRVIRELAGADAAYAYFTLGFHQ